MKQITVLLVDDNRVLRAEFKKILELEGDIRVIGEAKNGAQAIIMAEKLHPAVILMDVAMPVLNGLQATAHILETTPAAKVIMLSAHSDYAYVMAAVDCGARGYLIKQNCAETVCASIREVHKGKRVFGPSISVEADQRKRKTKSGAKRKNTNPSQ